MRKAEFNAWVRMKNAKNIQQSLSLYINTSNVGPTLYLVPVRPEGCVNISVKGDRKPKRKVKDDDEGINENKDVERVDES